MSTALMQRDDIRETYRWNLDVVYADDTAWESDAARLPGMFEDLRGFAGRLGDGAAVLLAALEKMEEVGRLVGRLGTYAMRKHDEDTSAGRYQSMADRARRFLSDFQSARSFMRPEVLALPDGVLEGYLDAEPGLDLWKHQIEDVLREAPYVLSQAEERLMAAYSEVARAPGTIFGRLSNADLDFGSVEDDEGNRLPLTHSSFQRYQRDGDRTLRRASFERFLGTFQAHRNTCASAYQNHVRAQVLAAELRGHPSSRAAALFESNVPEAVYDNLVATVRDYLPVFHRFYELRQRVLGLDEMHMWDVRVPLTDAGRREIEYDEAVETVLAAVAPLGEDYVATARAGLTERRWVDVFETPNKRSGAYSAGSFDTPPFILLNWQPGLDSMYTLAHELGHSMHSWYTRSAQPWVYANYTTFVAEVASTLNEDLLTRYLLERTDDPRDRLALLDHQLMTFRGTLFRQTMFAEYERDTHAAVEAGDALTADDLDDRFLRLNADYYGPTVVIDDPIANEWAYIPHFYYNFYVYQYATGIAAATALAESIARDGEPAAARYLRFLQGGSSQYPLELLRSAGVDMSEPAPIESAMKVFARRLDHLAELVR